MNKKTPVKKPSATQVEGRREIGPDKSNGRRKIGIKLLPNRVIVPMVDNPQTGKRLVVGVGASAGGLEAFKHLLPILPRDQGMTFLIVQHDPTHRSLLPELLQPCTTMKISEAADDTPLRANEVYVVPSNQALSVSRGRIKLSEPTFKQGVRYSVDHLFTSLAKDCGPRAVGVVLSGAGSDGTAGVRDIRIAGGLAIAQEPTTSGQPGMPESAINAGHVDIVLTIDEIPAALERYASLPVLARPVADPESEKLPDAVNGLSEDTLVRLAALFEAQENFDLRIYKSGTIVRRVLRRMGLSGYQDPLAYLDALRNSPTNAACLSEIC